MEREFLELMPHTVMISPFLGRDFDGVDQFGDPVEYRARIAGKGIALRRRSDEDDTVIFDVYIDAGDNIIRTEDKIELPPDAAWIDETPLIFSVGRYTDDRGVHHTKIQCGYMYHRQGQ